MPSQPPPRLRFLMYGDQFYEQFTNSCRKLYILITTDCASKWVEIVACKSNDNEFVIIFLREYFSHFGIPLRTVISDNGTQFCNRSLDRL